MRDAHSKRVSFCIVRIFYKLQVPSISIGPVSTDLANHSSLGYHWNRGLVTSLTYHSISAIMKYDNNIVINYCPQPKICTILKESKSIRRIVMKSFCMLFNFLEVSVFVHAYLHPGLVLLYNTLYLTGTEWDSYINVYTQHCYWRFLTRKCNKKTSTMSTSAACTVL